MRRIIILLALIASATFSLNAARIDEAKRFVKLAHTYRVSQDFDNANKYLDRASATLRGLNDWEGRYWKAAADEEQGYVYIDLAKGQPDFVNNHYVQAAKDKLNSALNEYRQLIRMRGGSQEALPGVISNIERMIAQLDGGSTATYYASSGAGCPAINASNSKLTMLQNYPKNMCKLDLTFNRFTDFPAGLTQYTNLDILDLSNNKISSMSADLSALKRLSNLDLSNNRITTIRGIAGLRALEEIDLSNNRLREVPADIYSMKWLKKLNLHGNPKIPISDIITAVRELPNTLILFDKYVPEEIEEEDENAIPGL